jgi:uncharacterized phage-associated protein
MISYRFDERKATQAAAHLIALDGGAVRYMKLLKLLYLADRHAILKQGCPITGDRFVSMRNGPVLSEVLDIIKGKSAAGNYWKEFISEPSDYGVELLCEAPVDELSEQELEWLDYVYSVYGHMSEWQLVEISHLLPEWEDPGASSNPIPVEQILQAAGASDEEIAAVQAENEAARQIDQLLGGS